MWERKKIEQMQRNLQELRNEVQSLKSENAHLKDVLEWEATWMVQKRDVCVYIKKTLAYSTFILPAFHNNFEILL